MVEISRKSVRNFLTSTYLKSLSRVDVDSVFPYQSDDIEGRSPVLRLLGSGRDRPRSTFAGSYVEFYFTLQILVIFNDENWTPEDAEDMLDDVEAELATVFTPINIPQATLGIMVELSRSSINKHVINGETYLIEHIPLIATITNPTLLGEVM
ncbi:MAG: hypothetical protein JRE40_00045 [Deltaproteobacteria bacterium]|nr:hypothetical protein [Deltaproteobacteria bacterium]